METISITDIQVSDRIRSEMGDIDALCNSIKEFGLIQPVVLSRAGNSTGDSDSNTVLPILVAGGRRLAAAKRLGWITLKHGRDFIWREEEDDLRRKSVEIEENLRRKELTWQEQVAGKQRLLTLMQSIHGAPSQGGGLTREQRAAGTGTGFGVNKLAAMLGESSATTSKDLEIASMLKALPTLASADTKESAFRKARIIATIAVMSLANKARAAIIGEPTPKEWTLYEGPFQDNIAKVDSESVDLVYTDLPFGANLAQMSKHDTGVVGYSDTRDGIVGSLRDLLHESYRILRPDRFAVFFFGFNYYSELITALESEGFAFNPVPVVWFKRTRSTESPNTRYANAYDPAIVAMKGSPVFIRPGQTNVIEIAPVTSSERMQIAQQPIELVTRFLQDMTSENALIVDLMAGSGTTGVAAIKAKRRVIMFEREPSACAIIKARMGAL